MPKWHMAIVEVQDLRYGDLLSKQTSKLITDGALLLQSTVFGTDLTDPEYGRVWVFLDFFLEDGSSRRHNAHQYAGMELIVHRRTSNPPGQPLQRSS